VADVQVPELYWSSVEKSILKVMIEEFPLAQAQHKSTPQIQT
jgi:hypothetical protein